MMSTEGKGGEVVYDVVVVGAGIIGLSAAYHVITAGKTVLLLDQFSLPHTRGSSRSGTRILCYAQNTAHRQNLMDQAYPLWKTWGTDTNTELYREIGLLLVAEKWTSGYPKDLLSFMERSGAGLELVSIEERTRRYPNFTHSTKQESYFYEKAGYIRANKALHWLQGAIDKRGGVLCEEEKVKAIVPGDVITVRTNRGEHRGRGLVLAPGTWAPEVLGLVGLSLPLQVARAHHIFWKEKMPGVYQNFPIFNDLNDRSFDCSGLPSTEYLGMMKVFLWRPGPIAHPDDRDVTGVVDKPDIDLSREYMREHFPGLDADNGPVIAEPCSVTLTPDDECVIDVHPSYPNIAIGCGFCGCGFEVAPGVGKILGQLALRDKPPIDIGPFSLTRF